MKDSPEPKVRDFPKPKVYVCLKCSHEQERFAACERCGSRRVEHVDFKRQQLGEHWRELMEAEKGTVN